MSKIFSFKKFIKKQPVLFYSVIFFLFISILILSFFLWSSTYKDFSKVKPLTPEQNKSLQVFLDQTYPLNRGNSLKPLPYPIVEANLDISAESAILIDASNGCILFEKNANKLIPPASITKLFVMYVVFKEIEAGNITLDDLVQPPEISWAINMPSDSSLMFLGQGHNVTLRELLLGLAIASGNDAAIAVANYISGNVKNFVSRMNYEVKALGLKNTHFEEPSGYSEKNITTARELAEFCRIYINKFPESLTEFHSKNEIRYPLEKNLPFWQKNKGDTLAVYQRNTNPLLNVLDGCDGLKTGFIYESGYNLSLTCKRGDSRYISVTMKGPGIGSKQGNFYRKKDGTTLMEWAFSSFSTYDPSKKTKQTFTIPALGCKGKFINLVPAWNSTITVPHIKGETSQIDANSVVAEISIPKFVYGGTKLGNIYGQIQYKLDGTILETVPLIADRELPRASIWGRFWGTLASFRFK